MKGLHTLLIFLPALLSWPAALCQDTTSRLSVVFSPAILVPVSIAAQIGVQYKVNKRWSLLGEIAVPTFYPDDSGYDELHYLRISTELKHRPWKSKNSMGYVALQTAYLFRRFIDKSSGVFETKEATFGYNSARINAPVLSSALKLGFELPAGKKLFFDFFTGMGVRLVLTSYGAENVFLTQDQPRGGFALVPEPAWRFNYTLARFHFTSGLKVGVRL